MLHQYTINDINRQPVILKMWLSDKNKENNTKENNVNKVEKVVKGIYNNSYSNKK